MRFFLFLKKGEDLDTGFLLRNVTDEVPADGPEASVLGEPGWSSLPEATNVQVFNLCLAERLSGPRLWKMLLNMHPLALQVVIC